MGVGLVPKRVYFLGHPGLNCEQSVSNRQKGRDIPGVINDFGLTTRRRGTNSWCDFLITFYIYILIYRRRVKKSLEIKGSGRRLQRHVCSKHVFRSSERVLT